MYRLFPSYTYIYSRNFWSFYHGSPQRLRLGFPTNSLIVSLSFLTIHPSPSHPSFSVLLWIPLQLSQLVLAQASTVPGSYEGLYKTQLFKTHWYGHETNSTFLQVCDCSRLLCFVWTLLSVPLSDLSYPAQYLFPKTKSRIFHIVLFCSQCSEATSRCFPKKMFLS